MEATLPASNLLGETVKAPFHGSEDRSNKRHNYMTMMMMMMVDGKLTTYPRGGTLSDSRHCERGELACFALLALTRALGIVVRSGRSASVFGGWLDGIGLVEWWMYGG